MTQPVDNGSADGRDEGLEAVSRTALRVDIPLVVGHDEDGHNRLHSMILPDGEPTGPASVIVVSYRTGALTAAAAASSLKAKCREVIVVDNRSSDETIMNLRKFDDPRLAIVERETNDGFAIAANEGADRATSDTLIFLNSDAMLTREAADALAEEVSRHGGRCIAGARLVGTNGEIQRSAGLLPGPVDLAIRALGGHLLASVATRLPAFTSIVGRTRLAQEHASAATALEPIDTTMVSGACFAMGREAFHELGGFDERFFMYFEDADLCRRAGQAGMLVRYVPGAVVPHVGGGSSSEDYHFGLAHARSMRLYLEKWHGPAGAVLALALLWLRAIGFTLTLRPQAVRAWKALRAAW